MERGKKAGFSADKKVIRHLVLVLYIGFIFLNSLTPASLSSQESGAVLQFALRGLAAAGIPTAWLTEHIIRKCAHFTEYTVLGILLYDSTSRLSCGGRIRALAHLFFLFFIPFVDETLQLFTEGRSGQISDVWLDMSGVLFGTLLSIAVRRLARRYFPESGGAPKHAGFPEHAGSGERDKRAEAVGADAVGEGRVE